MPPPRLAELLLKRCLQADMWREITLGDLREEFAARAQQTNRRTASRWYWRETVALLTSPTPHGPHDPPVRKDSLMRSLISESRLAARALWRQRTISVAIVATLAIGLGVNAATFGMIDALLLRPFTIPNVDRLVVLSELSAQDPYPQEAVAPANYLDLKRHTGGAISRMTTVSWWDVNMSGGDRPERLPGSQVGADFFTMLGVAPAAGRFFQNTDEIEGAPKTVVISDSLWQRRFAAAADTIGRTVQLDGEAYTVVGRTPPGFEFPNGSDLWTPLAFSADDRTSRTSRYLTVVGELAPGASVEQARAEMTAAYARLKQEHEAANRAYTLAVSPFTVAMVDYGMPRIMSLWQAAALLLLLIAGTNVMNLFLARGAERQRELAVRLAIGASRWRVVRQLLVESTVLALVAVPAALLVAWVSLKLIQGLLPGELVRFLPGWAVMGVSPRVMGFTALAALVSALLFGLLPAVRASRPALASSLKDGGRSSSSSVGRSRWRRGLVVAELALALPLLLSAGLAAVAAHKIASGPQGYDPDGLVRVQMSLPTAAYPDAAARRTFTTRLLSRLESAPGITEFTTTSVAPATGSNQRRQLVVDGHPVDPDGPRYINYRAISPNFQEALRIPVLEGRPFRSSDRDGTERVALISQSLAQLYWGDKPAIGARVKLSPTATDWYTVVGVTGNVLDDWFSSRNAPTVYVPVDQAPSSEIHILARGHGDSAAQIDALREAVGQVDPTLPVFRTETMRAAIHVRTTGMRFVSQLMAAFGVIALFLATAGIYSVMAHYVAQRRHEIGVRMALGASAGNVLTLTLGQGLRMAGLGIAIGLALGFGLGRFMESALFGVEALEPMFFVVGPLILASIAVLATAIPARAAMRVDPSTALRE